MNAPRDAAVPVKPLLVTNPGAGSSEAFHVLEGVLGQTNAVVRETGSPGEATDVAEAAAREGFDPVVAVGGDGTVNEVVNGLMRLDAPARPRFAILPFGTGNDLARTLALPPDPRDALALLLGGRTVPLDVFRVASAGTTRYGVNVAAGGFAGAVGEAMTPELKGRWGPLAYLIGAVQALPALTPFHLRLTLDDGPPRALDVFNVFVANARWVAGGKSVAPHARVDDGLLDVVVVERMTPAEMAAIASRFVAGTHLDSPHVRTYCARSVRVDSDPPLLFNVDGELLAPEPITFTALPGALRVVAGVDFEPAGAPFPDGHER